MYFDGPRPDITALDKVIDGRRLVIQVGDWSDHNGNGNANRGWLRATLDDQIVAPAFTTYVDRDATIRPDLPHTVRFHFGIGVRPAPAPIGLPHTDLRVPPEFRTTVVVGLTAGEADAFEAAQQQWQAWPGERAQAATPPGAEVREERGWSWSPVPGQVTVTARGPEMVLSRTWTRVDEDGQSLNLPEDEGYLYTIRVRDLTPDEAAWYTQQQAAR
jgi:hypothetical protein